MSIQISGSLVVIIALSVRCTLSDFRTLVLLRGNLLMLNFLFSLIFLLVFFFFSSRRRHTRFDCDWSSDVCSSDLGPAGARPGSVKAHLLRMVWLSGNEMEVRRCRWRAGRSVLFGSEGLVSYGLDRKSVV